MMRHWNTIAYKLYTGEVHVPLLGEDEDGTCRGNDWAWGFLEGVEMRRKAWSVLMDDKQPDGTLLPMLMLCYEDHEDPDLQPEPITPELREELIVHMAAGALQAYNYFRAKRG